MTQEVINKGTVAGDGTGETLFSAFTKINANFTELYGYSASALYPSAIGSTVQAYSANLSAYAAVNPTAAGLALLDDADAAAQRNTLGLGSAATANTGDFATAAHNHSGVYQPASANLTSYAGTAPTAAGLALVGAADAAAQRAALSLGSLATQSGTFSGTSSGTNTGDNSPNSLYSGLVSNATHTGDVTGSTVLTIANDAVTYAKMQNVSATDKLLGRSSAGAGDVEEITCTAAGRALLDDADHAAQRATLSLGSAALANTGDFATAGHNHSGVYQPADPQLDTWAGVTPGTGVATALAVNVGSAGAFATNNAANSWTAQQTFAEVKDTVYDITDGAAFQIDPANGSIQTITLTASRTPLATNFESGQIVLLGINDGTSAYGITWSSVNPTWVKGGGGASQPSIPTSGYLWVLLWKVGSTIYGCEVGKP